VACVGIEISDEFTASGKMKQRRDMQIDFYKSSKSTGVCKRYSLIWLKKHDSPS